MDDRGKTDDAHSLGAQSLSSLPLTRASRQSSWSSASMAAAQAHAKAEVARIELTYAGKEANERKGAAVNLLKRTKNILSPAYIFTR